MERPKQEDRLSAFFDGELPSNERSELEARLQESAELRQTLEEFERQRRLFASLERPALSAGFQARVMERVLAAAESTKAMPPVSPVAPRRRSFTVVISIMVAAAAVVGLGLFAVNALRPPTAGPSVAQGSGEKGHPAESNPAVVAEHSSSPTGEPDNRTAEPSPDSAIASARPNGASEASSSVLRQPEVGTEKTSTAPGEIARGARPEPKTNVATNSTSPAEPKSMVASSDSQTPHGGPQLAGNPGAANPKATMTTRPKAYRVQVGSRSEFDARLIAAGAAVYYPRKIDPPTDGSRSLRTDILPDPEYVLVEGSEAQLAEIVEKLKVQADLDVTELTQDEEAELLLAALTQVDAAGQAIRPAEAKEGELAAFTFSPKALMTLLPPKTPTTDSPSFTVDSARGAKSPQALPPLPSESAARWVPRVVFILDVRIGELEGSKRDK